MIAILENLRSLYNVGSIFRTADAAGVKKIYLCGITPAPVDRFNKTRRQIAKVSLGAHNYIRWEKVKSALNLIDELKKDGYKIFALEQSQNSISYFKLKPENKNSKIAIIVGNELTGLRKTILNKADKILEIPMFGRKESLNVSVAFGIVSFHFIQKQK